MTLIAVCTCVDGHCVGAAGFDEDDPMDVDFNDSTSPSASPSNAPASPLTPNLGTSSSPVRDENAIAADEHGPSARMCPLLVFNSNHQALLAPFSSETLYSTTHHARVVFSTCYSSECTAQ